MAACRSCGTEIVWGVTGSGKRIPLDAADDPHGNVLLNRTTAIVYGDAVQARSGRAQAEPFGEQPTQHVPHFATCPNAAAHRRTTPRRTT